ncbi:hypothetical protein [Rubritalea tangerina]|uniref:hypothetical protein n=1 Tax=Rubritalea tangerina TaxID=430798 RepID=UPI003612EC10
MLEISFQDLAISVLVFAMLMLGFLLVGRNSTDRQLRRRARREIMSCSVCGHLYQDKSGQKIVECPQCGRANLRGRDKSLG